MALQVVGGAFLSCALAVLFDRMASRPFVDFIRRKKTTSELLHKLKINLLSLTILLDDADERQIRDSAVRAWLDDLQDALYHADDLLDDITTHALDSAPSSSSSTASHQVLDYFGFVSITEFDKGLDSRIVEILDRLELVVNKKDVLDLKEGVRDRPRARLLPANSMVEECGVYGRDDEKEAVIEILLAEGATGNNTDVLPIVGACGIGKTTLAQLVYDDDLVKRHFDHRSWFCVSHGFDVVKIAQTICGLVTSQGCYITDLDPLQVKLETALTGKKFLFVFDDVWTVNNREWDFLSRSFQSGGKGSKIVVTTRIEGVARSISTIHSQNLMPLSEENCWILFSNHAFKDADAKTAIDNPLLEVIGRQIVQKCEGLPLAAKSLGSLLRTYASVEKWKEILNNDIWELRDKENDILPALWLSYYYLPPHLKRCFSYCSVFPQHYQFKKQELVLLWVAEDLILSKSNSTFEEVGHNYFDELLSRSFFLQGQDTSYFIMHDLIHDLAGFVSGDFCVRLESNDYVPKNICKSRYFSCKTSKFDQFESLHEAKYLRTFSLGAPRRTWQFLPKRYGYTYDLQILLLKLRSLRVLILSGYELSELPKSVGKLKHLRHIDLSYTSIKKLPDEICGLYNLQTLLLFRCEYITELPTDLGRLVNLCHLDIRYTCLMKAPQVMRNMKDLQIFGVLILDITTGCKIMEIKQLEKLQGGLSICGLRSIKHVRDATEANIKNKKFLEYLGLDWGCMFGIGDTEDTQKERDVLDNLQPHANVKEVSIGSYGGTRFPGWLERHHNLVCLRLRDCGNCSILPSMEHLHCLQDLNIEGFNGEVTLNSNHLRILSLRSCPQVTGAFMLSNFPKLERLSLWDVNIESLNSSSCLVLVTLEISECPNLVGFSDGGLDAPNLKTILIIRCRKLRSLPHHMHKLLPALSLLHLSDSPELESFPEGGLPSNLDRICIFDCKKLFGNRMEWGLTTLTSLRDLLIGFDPYGGCEQLEESFPDEGLLPETLLELHIFYATKLNGKGLTQLTSLKLLELKCSRELRCLPDEGLPKSLSVLQIHGCHLLKQRCRRDSGEDWPKISHVRNIILDSKRI